MLKQLIENILEEKKQGIIKSKRIWEDIKQELQSLLNLPLMPIEGEFRYEELSEDYIEFGRVIPNERKNGYAILGQLFFYYNGIQELLIENKSTNEKIVISLTENINVTIGKLASEIKKIC